MKVLFILSNDFGELSLATFFARNQAFNRVFVIPKSRAAYFDEVVDVLYTYQCVTELPRIINNESPDVISLNTAYLMINGNLATTDEFTAFISHLKSLPCPVFTTDPFVRVFDSYADCSFYIHGEPLLSLKQEMQCLHNTLQDLHHLYGFPCVREQDNIHSFFNSNYCISGDDKSDNKDEQNRWLFVLGELDAELLLAKYGEGFLRALVDRLVEVCKNTQNIVQCVFPKPIAQLLRQHLPKFSNLQIADFVTLSDFEDKVRHADAVFYWNVFSNSILLCYYYNIPFLFFGKGHIAELSVDLFNHMTDSIYRNGKPEFIDLFSPFKTDLKALLQQHYSPKNRQAIFDQYQSLQAPQTIVDSVLSRTVPNINSDSKNIAGCTVND